MKYDYIFLLGREAELSLAELKSVFENVETFGSFALTNADEEKINNISYTLGGTIKIGKILSKNIQKQDLLARITLEMQKKTEEGKKLRIGIDSFVPAFSSLVFKVKDALKNAGASVRVVQHEGGRIKTATTLHEKLVTQGHECMIIPTQEKNGYILAETMFVQDIDAYSKRDMERERSMVVGMMPPKIAQIMINMATKGDKDLQIWDAFCGLGTTMIEAWHAGYKKLIASDLSEAMVQATKTNMEKIESACIVFQKDAREIDTYNLSESTVIVAEGMLGKNFTPGTLNHKNALEERKQLSLLYSDFLNSSAKNNHIRSLVFCLPFWNVGREIVFMPEIPEMTTSWSINPLCKGKKRYIQHVRPGQSVGREIIILERKNKSQI